MAMIVGGFGASTAILAYQMINGELVKACLVPITGIILDSVGDYYKSETIKELGHSAILASMYHLPGMVSGYAVYVLGGKTLVATGVACVTGSFVTYKTYGAMLNKALDSLVKSISLGRVTLYHRPQSNFTFHKV
jgi:hypothetical protein